MSLLLKLLREETADVAGAACEALTAAASNGEGAGGVGELDEGCVLCRG